MPLYPLTSKPILLVISLWRNEHGLQLRSILVLMRMYYFHLSRNECICTEKGLHRDCTNSIPERQPELRLLIVYCRGSHIHCLLSMSSVVTGWCCICVFRERRGYGCPVLTLPVSCGFYFWKSKNQLHLHPELSSILFILLTPAFVIFKLA